MNIHSIIKCVKVFVVEHGPEILTAAGTLGLVASGVMAVKETPKAIDILKEHEKEKEEKEDLHSLTVKEKISDCWRIYLPSVLLATTSIASIIFARRIDSRRMAAWAAAYKMSEEALVRLENATKAELGERKFKSIEEKSEITEMSNAPVNDILVTGNGNDLYYDCYSATFFRSSANFIGKALNSYVKEILDEDYSDINGWITRLGLPAMDDDIGDQLGINSSMIRSEDLEIQLTYGAGPLDEPCGYLKLNIKPVPNYWNPHG